MCTGSARSHHCAGWLGRWTPGKSGASATAGSARTSIRDRAVSSDSSGSSAPQPEEQTRFSCSAASATSSSGTLAMVSQAAVRNGGMKSPAENRMFSPFCSWVHDPGRRASVSSAV